MAGLSPKQKKFVAEYLKDGNGTQAAVRAGYSPKTAGSQAHALLKKHEVQEVVGQRLEKLELSAEDVLRELQAIAFSEVTSPSEELDPGPLGGALARQRRASPRYEHKLKALELLGKHLKLFTERIEHTGRVSISVVDPYAQPPEGQP